MRLRKGTDDMNGIAWVNVGLYPPILQYDRTWPIR